MKSILCSVPDGPLKETLQSLLSQEAPYDPLNPHTPVMPFGVLRILSWMKKKGYDGDIYDINNLRPSDEELIKNFKRSKPGCGWFKRNIISLLS